ncbi:MAG: GlsB/YeaQ/YmgE family stress response membrane protein [Acidimicrobiia bacterium]|nr:GlsB/YeaQ/YmgE family stress response membrane protein [Acidimicrobiia bacterium]
MLLLIILVLGISAGWAAQLIVGTKRNWTEAALVGLAGSFVGGTISSLIAGDGFALEPSGLIGSIVGAVIVLLVWGRFRG